MHLIGGLLNWLKTDIVPLAPLVIAAGVVLAWLTYRQKTENDRHEQNWKRIQWSLDTALSDDPQSRGVGLEALDLLISEGGVDGRDASILTECATVIVREEIENTDFEIIQDLALEHPSVLAADLAGSSSVVDTEHQEDA